jgi:hypothetical protein
MHGHTRFAARLLDLNERGCPRRLGAMLDRTSLRRAAHRAVRHGHIDIVSMLLGYASHASFWIYEPLLMRCFNHSLRDENHLMAQWLVRYDRSRWLSGVWRAECAAFSDGAVSCEAAGTSA